MRCPVPILLLAVAALLGSGCAEETPEAPPAGPLTHDNMYALEVLPTFELLLDEEARASLAKEPKAYVRASFRYQDKEIGSIGVRLKGNFTLTTLDEKPSFKIKFNHIVPGRRFLGYEELILQNLHTDASMAKEWLAYTVFRVAGVPGPKVGYANMLVDGEPYGLYLNLESYSDDFLERAFEDPTGNLYEAESGDDIHKDPKGFDQDEGEDTSRADLEAFREQATEESDRVFFGDDALLDLEAFFAYVATEAFVGHFDGYQLPHNYYMYYDPGPRRWTYLPWSLDQAFIRKTSVFQGKGYLWDKCRALPHCRFAYMQSVLNILDNIDQLDPTARLDEVYDFIWVAAHNDERKRHTNKSLENDQKNMRSWVSSRTAELRDELMCMVEGEDPDFDGDGHGACYADCDDTDPDIFRGAAEVCDDIDNNCSGFADDVVECPCPSEEILGATFHFCPFDRKWTQAVDHCKAQGLQLAWVDTPEQNQQVWAAAKKHRGGVWAIGLNDRKTEDEYQWLNGEIPNFEAWADGQPAKELPWFDCVFYVSGSASWRERNCTESGSFICREAN